MLSFRLLGGLALDNPERVPLGRAAQRRRLALLAVLAAPAGLAVAREKLLGLLWPEVPPDEARHRLSVALYDLRQALGDDALRLTGHNVTLVPGAITLDVADFEDAIARQDWERAIAVYAGPFLDGVYLADAHEFEEWVNDRRAALQRSVCQALELTAAQRTGRGDKAGALEAWRRLTRIDPYSDRFAAGLMRALDAAGERATALRHAATHAVLLRAELGAESGAEVERASAELRTPITTPPQQWTAQGAGGTPSDPVVAGPIAAAESEAAPGDDVALSSAPIGGSAGAEGMLRTLPQRLRLAALLVVLAAAALSLLPSQAHDATDAANEGDHVATTSPAAERAFRTGEAHMRSGRFDAAVDAFARAVHEDSTFALAHFRLGAATLWADRPGSETEQHLLRALARRESLDELQSLLLEAFGAWRAGVWNDAEALSRRALMIDMGSVDAQHQLGETLFHYNPGQGRPISESRAHFEAVLAREPGHYGALWHLAQLAALERRTADVDALTARLLALGPDAVRALEVRVLRAAALADSAAFEAALQRLRHADESLLFGTAMRLSVFGRDFARAERVLALLTDSERSPYARALGQAQLLNLDLARGRTTAAERRLDELNQLGNASVWEPLIMVLLYDRSAVSSRLLDMRSAAHARESALVHAGSSATHRIEADVALALTQLLGDDSLAAAATISKLDAYAQSHPATELSRVATAHAATVRALHANQQQRHTDAIHWIDRAIVHEWFGTGLIHPLRSRAIERFLRAEALLALGQADQADTWFATIGEFAPADLVFLRAALSRRAEIADSRGDPRGANRFRAELRTLIPKEASAGRTPAAAF
ncbi:hypothetical protein BH23GEM9_BH23GEM9_08130 [soil metagenome]